MKGRRQESVINSFSHQQLREKAQLSLINALETGQQHVAHRSSWAGKDISRLGNKIRFYELNELIGRSLL